MIPDSIERETLVAAPVDRVWALLTEAEHIGAWFGDAGAEIDLRPGGRLVMRWTEHGEAEARIERVEPGRLFSYRWWSPFKGPDDEELTEGNSTLVEFTLTPEGEGTRLRVVESGFSALDGSPEQRADHHGDNTEGWRIELAELADYARRVHA
ncbi:MAG TPA: SRPBCC family protein [Thermoleophilaceae bacterium]|nr:SRPBCC family protein [Thermoleophilaceae bacterium]